MFLDEVVTRDSNPSIATREIVYTYEHPWLGSLEVCVAELMFKQYALADVLQITDNIAMETFRGRLNAIINVAAI